MSDDDLKRFAAIVDAAREPTTRNAHDARQLAEHIERTDAAMKSHRAAMDSCRNAADRAFEAAQWVKQHLANPTHAKEYLLYHAAPYQEAMNRVSAKDFSDPRRQRLYAKSAERLERLVQSCRREDVKAVRWACEQAVDEYRTKVGWAHFLRHSSSIPPQAAEPSALAAPDTWTKMALIPIVVIALLACPWRFSVAGADRYELVFGTLALVGFAGLGFAGLAKYEAKKRWMAEVNKCPDSLARDFLLKRHTLQLTSAKTDDAAVYETEANQVAERFNAISEAFIQRGWKLPPLAVGPSTSSQIRALVSAQAAQRSRARQFRRLPLGFSTIALIIALGWVMSARSAGNARASINQEHERSVQLAMEFERQKTATREDARLAEMKALIAARREQALREQQERAAARKPVSETHTLPAGFSEAVSEVAEAYVLANLALKVGDTRRVPRQELNRWLTEIHDQLSSAGYAQYCDRDDFGMWVARHSGVDGTMRPGDTLKSIIKRQPQDSSTGAMALLLITQGQARGIVNLPPLDNTLESLEAFAAFWEETHQNAFELHHLDGAAQVLPYLKAEIARKIRPLVSRRPRKTAAEISQSVLDSLRRDSRVVRFETNHPDFDLPAMVQAELSRQAVP